jgi:hypothetical protein
MSSPPFYASGRIYRRKIIEVKSTIKFQMKKVMCLSGVEHVTIDISEFL